MPQPLFDLLQRCTVKVIVPGDWGTGFFVAPGQVLTCAHVVKQHPVEAIELHQQETKIATVRQIHRPEGSNLDVVLLEVDRTDAIATNEQPCVWLGEAYETDDALYLYGFPSDFKPGAPTAGGVCDGETADERGALIKFRQMQIQPGHSGAALLNRKTGRVCGVVNKTRGAATDLGGVAVPVGEIWQQFPELKQRNHAFHQQDRRWADTISQQQRAAQDAVQRFHVPFLRNVYFTGREDILLELHGRLQGGSAVINQTQGIAGLGGIGKTQTAVEYAYRHFEVAYDWVFWLRADTLVNLQTDLGAVARQVGAVADPNLELEQQIQVALRWLNTQELWLLVVDNADDDTVLAALPTYLPTNPKGRVLITSRQAVLDGVNVAEPLPLGTWARQSSVDFLLKRTGRPDTEAEQANASQLAAALGDLPLALEQAAAYMVRRQTPFRLYGQQYEKQRLKLLEKEKVRAGQYAESVRTTWQINFDAVAEANPASAELLQLSAVLAPDEIPYELLILGRQHWTEALQQALEADDWDTAVFLMGELLEPLSQYSLIRWEAEDYRYSIHRMVQEVIRDQMPDKGLEWANRAVAGVWQAFPDSDQLDNWSVCDRLLPHGLRLRPWLTREQVWTETGGRLLNELGYFLEKRGQYNLSAEIFEQALEMRRELLGDRHPNVATSLNNLAALYRSQGRYDAAEPYYQQALEMRRELLGDRHPSVASSLNNLAALYESQGRYEAAEPYYLQALEMRRELLGDRHPDVAGSLWNLSALRYQQGRLNEAESLLLEALPIYEERLGLEHPNTKNLRSWIDAVQTSLNGLA